MIKMVLEQIGSLFAEFAQKEFNLTQCQWGGAGVSILPPVDCGKGDAKSGREFFLRQTDPAPEFLHESLKVIL